MDLRHLSEWEASILRYYSQDSARRIAELVEVTGRPQPPTLEDGPAIPSTHLPLGSPGSSNPNLWSP